jgi:hypothetical protein
MDDTGISTHGWLIAADVILWMFAVLASIGAALGLTAALLRGEDGSRRVVVNVLCLSAVVFMTASSAAALAWYFDYGRDAGAGLRHLIEPVLSVLLVTAAAALALAKRKHDGIRLVLVAASPALHFVLNVAGVH